MAPVGTQDEEEAMNDLFRKCLKHGGNAVNLGNSASGGWSEVMSGPGRFSPDLSREAKPRMGDHLSSGVPSLGPQCGSRIGQRKVKFGAAHGEEDHNHEEEEEGTKASGKNSVRDKPLKEHRTHTTCISCLTQTLENSKSHIGRLS